MTQCGRTQVHHARHPARALSADVPAGGWHVPAAPAQIVHSNRPPATGSGRRHPFGLRLVTGAEYIQQTSDHAPPRVGRVQDLPDTDTWLDDHLRVLGARIRAERLRQGATQEAVYLAAGIDRLTLQHLEAGRGNPTYRVLMRVAHVLDVPLAELVR
ncbi:helix-turn-helix domain-containing protein [Streptomyces griseosporeus]|uniref:helix-turn-helix domain-containing protein n=1 Tax=Streptomyces griseosporeus TaxID=1910 RepID=UPI0036F761BA